MKKSIHILFILLVTALTLFTHTVLAQAPQGIPYQAVARDNAGATLANQAISLRLSIHDTTATGTIVYQETQTATSNSLGLFNLNIGQGTAITGTLSGVNWGSGSKFIQVEMDPTGGTTYTDMGTTQLMSVPYALSSADNQWTKSGNDISSSNSGNVGIGTSTPISKLTIDENNSGNFNTVLQLDNTNNGFTNSATISLKNFNASDRALQFVNWNSTSNTYSDAFTFNSDYWGPILTMDHGGNVGIGTTNPVAKLEVQAYTDTAFYAKSNWATMKQIGVLGTYNQLGYGAGVLGIGYLGTMPPNGVDIGVYGSAHASSSIAVWSNGKLRVTDGTQGIGKILTSDATGIASWQTLNAETDPQVSSTTSNKIPKWNGTTLTDGIVTDNGTNIGIGTSTPVAKLDVNGTIKISGGNPAVGKVLTSDATGIASWQAETDPQVSSTSTNNIPKWNGTTLTDGTITDSASNIGIGTSNPAAKLDVNGTIKISGGNPAVGKVLTSDATGIASWQTPDSETDPQVSSTSTNKIPKWNGTALVDGVMTDNGTNIGIGTTTPGAKLHVNGILRAQADASSKAIEFYQSNGTQGWEMFVNNTGLSICEQGVACDRLVVAAGGNVGIGTATPAAPLHVAGTPITTASQNRTYFHYGSAITTNFAASNSIQVRADGWFWANNGGFVATSDQRIKNKIGLTNTQGDLNDLSKIEITNYKYIDEFNNGSKLHKKVIAQQLNSVYPLAVDTTKGIIPNVYEVAKHVSVKNNSTLITTNKAHDFKTGDEVKLIIENLGEKLVHVDVVDDHTFSVNEIIHDKVFVFGKHIDDLLIVDYDALTTLTISATQELLKRIELLEKENYQLKELNESYNAKLLHIEDRLNILSTPTSTTTAQK